MAPQTDKLNFATVLASSVHDMKNSVAMLLGSLSEITSTADDLSAQTKDKLSRIQHEGNRLNRDLVQLLTMYKLDRKQQDLNINEVNIFEFFNEIILEHQPLLEPRGIYISQQCDESLFGYFDEELVGNIIKTIINNAYQYTTDKILLAGKYKEGFLVLSVVDNGKGYPDSMLADTSLSKTSTDFDTGATGLGLYFSKRIAEMHKNKDKSGYIKLSNNTTDHASISGGSFSLFLP